MVLAMHHGLGFGRDLLGDYAEHPAAATLSVGGCVVVPVCPLGLPLGPLLLWVLAVHTVDAEDCFKREVVVASWWVRRVIEGAVQTSCCDRWKLASLNWAGW